MSKFLKIIFSISALSVMIPTADAGPTLDRIKSNKAITLGYRESSIPFSYLGANQQPVGFSLDLCSYIINRLEIDIGEKLKINKVAVNSSNRIPLIQNGTVDIECGGTSSSKARLQQVTFSYSTFMTQSKWLTLASSNFKNAADLKGKTVVVTQGSNAVSVAQQISKDDSLNLNIIQAKDHAESMLMLTSGRAVAFMEDDILEAGLRAQSGNPQNFVFLPDEYNKVWYGLMMSKDDAEFKGLVDEVLASLMKSGEFETLYNKWFMKPIPPNNINIEFPMTKALEERIKHPSDEVDY